MNMDAITNQLHIGTGIRCRSLHPRLPVMEGQHGIEQVSNVVCPCLKGRHGSIIICCSMGQRNIDLMPDSLNKLNCPRLLRRNVHQADSAP